MEEEERDILEFDPLYTASLGELLRLVGSLTVQDAPEVSHAAIPRCLWILLGCPRHLLVEDSLLDVVPSDTLVEEAYFYNEDACN